MKTVNLTLAFMSVIISNIPTTSGIYLPKYTNKGQLDISHHKNLTLPDSWNWGNVSSQNYLTKNLNQHIPQYCGSCWAHGALSSLGDRIKIKRKGQGVDINLPVQFLLNCGTNLAGSCNGGDHYEAYKFIKDYGSIPFDTCLTYEACSSDSDEVNCKGDYSCIPDNICKTCSTFTRLGGSCSAIHYYPNVTIDTYGRVFGDGPMKQEIYENGPIACGINANAILNYTGGLIDLPTVSKEIDHIISIVGWEVDPKSGKQYWQVRNSWGEYWGELGYIRVVMGENQLGLESDCAWVRPGTWTESNVACHEDGGNC